jgi:hypothetical protein
MTTGFNCATCMAQHLLAMRPEWPPYPLNPSTRAPLSRLSNS